MSEKILFVDDEQNVLDGIRRQLRKRYEVTTACGPELGLKELEENGPYAVIISDMKMPGMTGAEFLTKARQIFPDGVRMILSGQSELDSAIKAVNEGNIFRFLTKPCPPEALVGAIESGLTQYRLVIAERQLLEQTLSGSVKVLTEILGLLSPKAFSRSLRIQQYVEQLCELLSIPDRWQLKLAAMLCEIGCVSLPSETLGKLEAGQPLSAEEQGMVKNHPDFAKQLLGKIPRLEIIASIVARHREAPGDAELPEDPLSWDAELLGARALGVSRRFDEILSQGSTPGQALQDLREEGFAESLLDALAKVKTPQGQLAPRSMGVGEMRIAMVLDQDVRTVTGLLLVPKGQEITETVLVRLRSFADSVGVEEPCEVLVPA